MHHSLDTLLITLILRVRSCLGGFLSLLPSHQSAYSLRDFEFSILFQIRYLRARTALLTLGFPGELIRKKIDGVFILVLIAAATLTRRLQKHKKATA